MQKRSWCLTTALAAVLATSCYAATPAAVSPADTQARVHTETLRLLESVEQAHPDMLPQTVKIRERVDYLYRQTKSADERQEEVVPLLERAEKQASKRRRYRRGEDPFAGLGTLSDKALVSELNKRISDNLPLEYSASRRIVFLTLDNREGYVECVYTGRTEHLTQMPNNTDMNIEHSWPQSLGATGVAKADLHHLFPTDSKANGTRGSLPFGPVSNPNWAEGGSKCDGDTFEVRPASRGNIARAQFYFSVRYGKEIPNQVESVLREWHKSDPVDAVELERNGKIEGIQHNRNPFVDHPEFVEKIKDF
ncbi:MAG TPA: endonuclease [Candidatus Ozemobacteraceae bacterium]|nr:endonuclease [Candidatus Ozemobacteraceae bacterium]